VARANFSPRRRLDGWLTTTQWRDHIKTRRDVVVVMCAAAWAILVIAALVVYLVVK
jgi:hypothetical protein